MLAIVQHEEEPARGERCDQRLDGRAVARVNLWRSSFSPRVVLYQKTFRSTGRHTLTIQVLAASGRLVAIDAFRVRR